MGGRGVKLWQGIFVSLETNMKSQHLCVCAGGAGGGWGRGTQSRIHVDSKAFWHTEGAGRIRVKKGTPVQPAFPDSELWPNHNPIQWVKAIVTCCRGWPQPSSAANWTDYPFPCSHLRALGTGQLRNEQVFGSSEMNVFSFLVFLCCYCCFGFLFG